MTRLLHHVAYRAGWPYQPQHQRRIGLGWVYIGPWVVGWVRRWSECGIEVPRMTREQILAEAIPEHDKVCGCDRRYRMSCPRLAQIVLDQSAARDVGIEVPE